jgi:hypothetical protein
MTKYHVLRSTSLTAWEVAAADVEAHSATGAVRGHITELLKQEGATPASAYVAVPVKSWQPTQVAVETQTRIRIGDVA